MDIRPLLLVFLVVSLISPSRCTYWPGPRYAIPHYNRPLADDENICNCHCIVEKAGTPGKANFVSPCCRCLVDNCPCDVSFYVPKLLGFCKPCGCNCGVSFSKLLNKPFCTPCGCGCGACEDKNGKIICCTCKKKKKKSCFPSMARVSLENGKSVRMSELEIGDRVQTVSSTGIVKVNEVQAFLKREYTTTTIYKSIRTASNSISLAGNHLIYSRKPYMNRFNAMFADDVSINDEVLVLGDNGLISTKVTNISSSIMEGAFAPVTMDGNIMVDDVLASCYASFQHHDVAHIGMTPIHWFPEVIGWIFGDNNGSPLFITVAEDVAKIMMPFELNL